MQTLASLGGCHHAPVCCRHNETVGECDIIYHTALSVGTQIVGLLYLVTVGIHHHHAETCCQINLAAIEADIVHLLVTPDTGVMDVGDMVHLTFVDKVQTRVVVCYGKHLGGGIICHRADAHICQSVHFGHGLHHILCHIITEQRHAGGGIHITLSNAYLADSDE